MASSSASEPLTAGENDDDVGCHTKGVRGVEDAGEEEEEDSPSCRQLHHSTIFICLGVAFASDATEILSLNYALSNEEFRETILLGDEKRGSSLASAVFMGMLIGSLLVGALGDRHGRRPALLTGLAINCMSGVASGLLTIDVLSMTAFRLLAGIGIGATVPPLFTLCGELSPPPDRGFWIAFMGWFWKVGSIYVALVGWLLLGQWELSWRFFIVVCSIPGALGWLLIYYNVPESPRFLALRGRHSEALVATRKLAGRMHFKGLPASLQEIQEQYPSNTAEDPQEEDMSKNCVSQFILSPIKDYVNAVSQLFAPPGLRYTTILLQLFWFSLSYSGHGINTWISTLFMHVHMQNIYKDTLIYTLSGIPGMFVAAILLDRTGRVVLLVGGLVSAAVSLLCFAYVAAAQQDNDDEDSEQNELDPAARIWILMAACLFNFSMAIAFDANATITSEQLPTIVRSTGLGLCSAWGKVGAMLAQWVNGSLVGDPSSLLVVTACVLLAAATASTFLPSDRTGKPVVDRLEIGPNRDQLSEMVKLSSTKA